MGKTRNGIIRFLSVVIFLAAVLIVILGLNFLIGGSLEMQPTDEQDEKARIAGALLLLVGAAIAAFGALLRKIGIKKVVAVKSYDAASQVPVIRASICNGEQVAGFKDIHTGDFHEVMLIRSAKDLEDFKTSYGISGEIEKTY